MDSETVSACSHVKEIYCMFTLPSEFSLHLVKVEGLIWFESDLQDSETFLRSKTTRRVGNRTRVHCDFSYERVVADMVKTRYFRGWVEGNDRNWLVICIPTWFSWVKTHIRTSKSHGNFLPMFEDSCVLP